MQQAGIVGLFRILLIIFIFIYAFRFLTRLLAPILMKRIVNKMQQRAQQQQYNQKKRNTTSAKEGETVIDRKPSSGKQSDDSVGEYVDFEEID